MNVYRIKLVYYLLNFLSLIFDYVYVLVKLYRILIFVKLTFDQMPIYNPYKWPLSFIRIMTKPYLAFWAQFLPRMRFGNQSYDVSTIVALEVLATFIRMAFRLKLILNFRISELAKLIK